MLESISPPTDHLYKFAAIAGILCITAIGATFHFSIKDLVNRRSDLEIQIAQDRASFENLILKEQWLLIKTGNQKLGTLITSEYETGFDKDTPERRRGLLRNTPAFVAHILRPEVFELMLQASTAPDARVCMDTTIDQISDLQDQAHTKLLASIERERQLNRYETMTTIELAILGSSISILLCLSGWGFHQWYQRIQKPSDVVLESSVSLPKPRSGAPFLSQTGLESNTPLESSTPTPTKERRFLPSTLVLKLVESLKRNGL